jgi:hypothetical protein
VSFFIKGQFHKIAAGVAAAAANSCSCVRPEEDLNG